MIAKCYNCGRELDFKIGERAPRSSQCQSCKRDVRACKNCEFYDENAYNLCKEPQADRVVDKEKSNFCDYFKLSNRESKKSNLNTERKKTVFEDLFKK